MRGVASTPYYERIAAAGGLHTSGRPKRGEVREPTGVRSIRLPAELWKLVEAQAKREQTASGGCSSWRARRPVGKALRLMLALEREALAIFKVARRLGDPAFTPKDYDKFRAHHARSAIVDRLR